MQDSQQLRELIVALIPGIAINGAPAASGQRVVYFASAKSCKAPIPDGSVVVKVCAGLSPASITYLQREIKLLRQISSAYFPKLHYSEVFANDPRTDDPLIERLFVTVEQQIEGWPLSEVTALFNTPERVTHLLKELVRAGQILWTSKPPYVHRDLKPANILVRSDLSVCVIDLGIVREEGDVGVTNAGDPWGPCTPAYASPEQVTNKKMDITFKSDFFSIGVILYELLSAHNPFVKGANVKALEVFESVLKTVPPPLKKIGPTPEALSDLIEVMMAKEPYKRPRSPEILLKMIESL